MSKKVEVTRGSGNVFADLGFAEPEEELAKANALMLIQQAVRRRGLSRAAAATLMSIDQVEASMMLSGRGATFTSGRLSRLLLRLKREG